MQQLSLKDIEAGSVVEVEKRPVLYLGSVQETNNVIDSPMFLEYRNNTLSQCMTSRRVWGAEQMLPVFGLDVAQEFHAAARKDFEKMTWVRQEICLGSDPEIFAQTGSGEIFPAWEWLPSKADGAGMYWDGLQGEFTSGVSYCLQGYADYMQNSLRVLQDRLVSKDSNAKFVLQTAIEVPERILRTADDAHVLFGCSKSMNVYNDSPEIPTWPREYKWRTVGGHIHAGLPKKYITPKNVKLMTQALDVILALPSVGIAAGIDRPERREIYGRCGEIRLPKHGLEYRVLSNYWLFKPALMHLTHELFRSAIRFGLSGLFSVVWDGDLEEVRRIVNECDVSAARKMVKDKKEFYRKLFRTTNFGAYPIAVDAVFEIVERGAINIMPGLENLKENWGISGHGTGESWSNWVRERALSAGV